MGRTPLYLKVLLVALACAALCAPDTQSSDRITPKAKRKTLANGMRVILIENPELPLINFRLSVDAGSKYDPPNLNGLASVTRAALLLGAGEMDARAMQRHIDSIGATVSSGTTRDKSYITGQIHSREGITALRLILSILQAPQLSAEDITASVRRHMSRAYQSYDVGRPAMLDIAYETLYGSHPLGRPPLGALEDLESVSKADVDSFYKRFYSPQRTKLVIAGDINSNKMMSDIATVFTPLGRGEEIATVTTMPELESVREQRIVLLDAPAEHSAWVGVYALADSLLNTGAFAAQRMLAHILGENDELSLIGRRLKEQRRLISQLITRLPVTESPALLSLEMSCARENVVDVIDETLSELQLLRETRISKRELEDSKKYFRGSYALGFETSESIVERISEVVSAGRDYRYHDSLLISMNALTQRDIKTAANELFSADRMVIVVYGDADSYARQLEEFGVVTRQSSLYGSD